MKCYSFKGMLVNNDLLLCLLTVQREHCKRSVDTIINLSLLIQSHLYSALILLLARVSLLLLFSIRTTGYQELLSLN